MENLYKKMMETVETPRELEDRVLLAAGRQEPAAKHPAKRNWRPALRGVACAACALALVLGTVRFAPAEQAAEPGGDTPVMQLDYSFGLTACAAGEERTAVPGANGGMAFAWVEGGADFRVTGADIESIALCVDRGTLWRAGICFGRQVTEAYAPDAVYGLRLAGGEEDMAALDGAVLRVTAVFADGVEQTKKFTLSAGDFRVARDEEGVETYFLTLAGDTAETISGLYVSPEESTWLRWPVTDSGTIDLSAPYGQRTLTIDSEPPQAAQTITHSGIDIPAECGTAIAAAAGGRVTEAGFDPERGNYLILDHGEGLTTLYGQCQSVEVKKGDTVGAGETIARVGATGAATGPHLHFEVRQDGAHQNPVAYFDSAVRATLKME